MFVNIESAHYVIYFLGTAESNGVISNRRALKTVLIDSGNGTYEMAQMYDDNEGVAIDSRGEPINVGAITTAETGESLGVGSDPFPQGMKMRRYFFKLQFAFLQVTVQ